IIEGVATTEAEDEYDTIVSREAVEEDLQRFLGQRGNLWEMHRQPVGRVLEIGCGNGHTLRGLAELGFTVRGCEVNAAAARHCEEQGLQVKALPFEKYRIPPPNARFDYVVSVHVLEHVADPAAFAEKVFKLLKPGGLWFNYMPNVAVTERYGFDAAHGADWIHFRPTGEPQHITFFDPGTARWLIETAGLEFIDGGATLDAEAAEALGADYYAGNAAGILAILAEIEAG
ncbi:MAG: methyltransferase domain-containing protein, partial [Candidatus Coatesbacteria bacterium]|nr:methyltransferase domain-containing protein [Candidatus Coatesbacteria bacterium]